MTKSSFELYEVFFKTISNETRFEIVRLLTKGPKSVNAISKTLNFEQSRVSHNLKRLECYGFIICECKGKERIYSIDKKSHIIDIIKSVDKYIMKYNKRLKECMDHSK
jgi:predicted transcriptional regulator